jgi:DNA-binding XRE family transcriptional regulator
VTLTYRPCMADSYTGVIPGGAGDAMVTHVENGPTDVTGVEVDDASTYAEIIRLLESLPVLVRETRRRKRQSIHQAGDDCGLSGNTISRLEQGLHDPTWTTTVRVLRWMST